MNTRLLTSPDMIIVREGYSAPEPVYATIKSPGSTGGIGGVIICATTRGCNLNVLLSNRDKSTIQEVLRARNVQFTGTKLAGGADERSELGLSSYIALGISLLNDKLPEIDQNLGVLADQGLSRNALEQAHMFLRTATAEFVRQAPEEQKRLLAVACYTRNPSPETTAASKYTPS